MENVRVRDYRPEDRAACIAIFESNIPKFFDPIERKYLDAFLDELPGPYLVVVDELDRVLGAGGYAIRKQDPETADLTWGMVLREHHGKGLGQLLLDERLARVKQDPTIQAVCLGTSQHTTAFFERVGFVTTRVVQDGYAPGIHLCDMRLELNRNQSPK